MSRTRMLGITRFRALQVLYIASRTENTAPERAKRLLRQWLTPDQQNQFNSSGFFEVIETLAGQYRERVPSVRTRNSKMTITSWRTSETSARRECVGYGQRGSFAGF